MKQQPFPKAAEKIVPDAPLPSESPSSGQSSSGRRKPFMRITSRASHAVFSLLSGVSRAIGSDRLTTRVEDLRRRFGSQGQSQNLP